MLGFKSLVSVLEHNHSIVNMKVCDELQQYHGVNIYRGEPALLKNIVYICESLPKKSIVTDTNALIFILEYPGTEMSYPCNCIYLQPDANILDVFSEIQEVFIKQLENDLTLSTLLRSLIDGSGIKELVKLASKILNNPIILTTASYKVIAMSDNKIVFNDPVWDDAKTYGYCSADSISRFQAEGVTERVHKSDHAFLLDQGFAKDIPRVLQKIIVKKKIVAYLGVFEVTHRFRPDDLKLIDSLCELITIELKNEPVSDSFTNVIYQSILAELLNKSLVSPAVLKERLSTAQWKLKPYFCCVTIDPKWSDKKNYQQEYIIASLSSQISCGKVMLYKQQIVIVLNYSRPEQLEYAIETMDEILAPAMMTAGISPEFSELLKLSDYYKAAKIALEIGRITRHEGRHILFDSVIPYLMISKIPLDMMGIYYEPKYRKLIEYDLEHNTQFEKTLNSYLDHACNISLSAKALFIHRNTMAQRLERITQIADIDLSDGRLLFRCYLSSYLRRWQQFTST